MKTGLFWNLVTAWTFPMRTKRGETDFPEKGEWELRNRGQRGMATAEHVFDKAKVIVE